MRIAWPIPTVHPDRSLDGRGLVVVPSVFCPPGAPIAQDLADPAGPCVLFYPATRDPNEIRGLWHRDDPRHQSLATLLGRTRAAVLEAICRQPATTSELAHHCRISPSSASEHATVLRQARLIHSQRHGSAVLHTITPVGAKLIAP